MKTKTYSVKKVKNDIDLSILNHNSEHWKKATILNEFCSPWCNEVNSKIEFKALWNADFLFFSFSVLDISIHIDNTDNTHKSINESDRVELFFRTNASMSPYYCLEIDPTPRIMDFKAFPNKEFDFNWNWPKTDLFVESFLDNKGYCVTGKISISSLNKLNLIQNGKIETGVFRAKYYKTKNDTYKPHWITWVDPKTKDPNFHISHSFGTFILQNY